jgi:hypothetical protein
LEGVGEEKVEGSGAALAAGVNERMVWVCFIIIS